MPEYVMQQSDSINLMSDFWKGVIAVLTLQWLFGNGNNSGCGCRGCLTVLVLGICVFLTLFNLW